MKKVRILIQKLKKDVRVPGYMTEYASGMDLYAAVKKPVVVKPLERVLIPSGIVVEIPAGYEIQIRPRSGLAWKYGIGVLNSPGTIDSDYRGEVRVILINLSNTPFTITPGMRIAQMVLSRVEHGIIKVVKKLNPTKRGSRGFGHTGT